MTQGFVFSEGICVTYPLVGKAVFTCHLVGRLMLHVLFGRAVELYFLCRSSVVLCVYSMEGQ